MAASGDAKKRGEDTSNLEGLLDLPEPEPEPVEEREEKYNTGQQVENTEEAGHREEDDLDPSEVPVLVYYGRPWHRSRSEDLLPGVRGTIPERITDGPEWRNIKGKIKGMQRASSASTYYLPTRQASLSRRPNKTSSISFSHKIPRIKPWGGASSTKESKIIKADRLLRRVLGRLELSNNRTIISMTSYMIKEYIESKYSKSKRSIITDKEIAALVAASIYIAVSLEAIAIQESEIYEAVLAEAPLVLESTFNLNRDSLEGEAWIIKRRLAEYGIVTKMREYSCSSTTIPCFIKRINNFIIKIVSESDIFNNIPFNIKKNIVNLSKQVIIKSYNNGKIFIGKNHAAIAAASLYMSGRLFNINVNQKDLADSVNLKESNIRKMFRFLVEDQIMIVVLKPVEAPVFFDPSDIM